MYYVITPTFLDTSNFSHAPFSHLPDVLPGSVAVLVVGQVEPESPVLHQVAVARLRLIVAWWLGSFCDVIKRFCFNNFFSQLTW